MKASQYREGLRVWYYETKLVRDCKCDQDEYYPDSCGCHPKRVLTSTKVYATMYTPPKHVEKRIDRIAYWVVSVAPDGWGTVYATGHMSNTIDLKELHVAGSSGSY